MHYFFAFLLFFPAKYFEVYLIGTLFILLLYSLNGVGRFLTIALLAILVTGLFMLIVDFVFVGDSAYRRILEIIRVCNILLLYNVLGRKIINYNKLLFVFALVVIINSLINIGYILTPSNFVITSVVKHYVNMEFYEIDTLSTFRLPGLFPTGLELAGVMYGLLYIFLDMYMRNRRAIYLCLAVLCACNIFGSQSRTFIVVLLLSFPLFIILYRNYLSYKNLFFMTALIPLLLFLTFSSELLPYASKLLDHDNSIASFNTRMNKIINLFPDHNNVIYFLLGFNKSIIGPSNFSMDNSFISIFILYGFVGFLIALILITYVFLRMMLFRSKFIKLFCIIIFGYFVGGLATDILLDFKVISLIFISYCCTNEYNRQMCLSRLGAGQKQSALR